MNINKRATPSLTDFRQLASPKSAASKSSPTKAVAKLSSMEAIRSAFASGNDSTALKLANAYLEEHPEDTGALLVTARIYNRQKDWQRALDAWMQLATVDSEASEPLLQIARIHQRSEGWVLALQSAQALLFLQTDHLEALRICLNSQRKLGDLLEASKTTKRLLDLGCTSEEAGALKLTVALLEQGAHAEALHIATKLVEVAPHNTEASTLQSKVLTSILVDGLAAHLEGQEEVAAEACRSILRVVPNHVRATQVINEIIRPSLLDARAAFKAESFDAAAQAYAEVLRIYPDHVESTRAMGRIHGKARNHPAAAEYWSRLEHLTPEDHEPSLQLARICVRLGEFDQAYARFGKLAGQGVAASEEATKSLQTLALRLMRTAAACIREGQLDEACRLSNLLDQTQPELEGLSELKESIVGISFREASLAFKGDDFAAAASHAQRALVLNPVEEKSLIILARAAYKIADFNTAAKAWERLHQMKPNETEPLLQIARHHLRFKEYAQAAAACRKLMVLAPEHSEGLHILQAVESKIAETPSPQ